MIAGHGLVYERFGQVTLIRLNFVLTNHCTTAGRWPLQRFSILLSIIKGVELPPVSGGSLFWRQTPFEVW